MKVALTLLASDTATTTARVHETVAPLISTAIRNLAFHEGNTAQLVTDGLMDALHHLAAISEKAPSVGGFLTNNIASTYCFLSSTEEGRHAMVECGAVETVLKVASRMNGNDSVTITLLSNLGQLEGAHETMVDQGGLHLLIEFLRKGGESNGGSGSGNSGGGHDSSLDKQAPSTDELPPVERVQLEDDIVGHHKPPGTPPLTLPWSAATVPTETTEPPPPVLPQHTAEPLRAPPPKEPDTGKGSPVSRTMSTPRSPSSPGAKGSPKGGAANLRRATSNRGSPRRAKSSRNLGSPQLPEEDEEIDDDVEILKQVRRGLAQQRQMDHPGKNRELLDTLHHLDMATLVHRGNSGRPAADDDADDLGTTERDQYEDAPQSEAATIDTESRARRELAVSKHRALVGASEESEAPPLVREREPSEAERTHEESFMSFCTASRQRQCDGIYPWHEKGTTGTGTGFASMQYAERPISSPASTRRRSSVCSSSSTRRQSSGKVGREGASGSGGRSGGDSGGDNGKGSGSDSGNGNGSDSGSGDAGEKQGETAFGRIRRFPSRTSSAASLLSITGKGGCLPETEEVLDLSNMSRSKMISVLTMRKQGGGGGGGGGGRGKERRERSTRSRRGGEESFAAGTMDFLDHLADVSNTWKKVKGLKGK